LLKQKKEKGGFSFLSLLLLCGDSRPILSTRHFPMCPYYSRLRHQKMRVAFACLHIMLVLHLLVVRRLRSSALFRSSEDAHQKTHTLKRSSAVSRCSNIALHSMKSNNRCSMSQDDGNFFKQAELRIQSKRHQTFI
jgi:hypothetical protein